MAVTQAAVEGLLEPLRAIRPITSRKMFGGVGVYCDGVFFACIDDDRLYFKADELTLPMFETYGAEQWEIEGQSGGPMPYWEVPSAILADSEALGGWIDAAVGVANRKKKPKKR